MYLQEHGSKETVPRYPGKTLSAQDAELGAVLWKLGSFFSLTPPNFAKNTPLFNKCQIFTLSLQLSIFTFTLLWGIICLLGIFSQN
jgi:hypothetical protein